jgi:hypothetical protein
MFYKPSAVFLLLSIILLSACSAAAPLSATPIPTQQVWKVAFTSSLAVLTQDFHSCLDPQSNITILIEEIPDPSGLGVYDFGFSWGDLQSVDQPTFVLGYDHLKVIVNGDNPVDSLSVDDIQGIFNGSTTRWGQLEDNVNHKAEDIHAWLYSRKDDLYRIAEQTGLIQANIQAVTLLAPDPDAMRAEIEEDPAAIGILPGIWLSSGIKALAVEGGRSQPAQQPILVLTSEKPQGAALDWLLCLQERVSDRISP